MVLALALLFLSRARVRDVSCLRPLVVRANEVDVRQLKVARALLLRFRRRPVGHSVLVVAHQVEVGGSAVLGRAVTILRDADGFDGRLRRAERVRVVRCLLLWHLFVYGIHLQKRQTGVRTSACSSGLRLPSRALGLSTLLLHVGLERKNCGLQLRLVAGATDQVHVAFAVGDVYELLLAVEGSQCSLLLRASSKGTSMSVHRISQRIPPAGRARYVQQWLRRLLLGGAARLLELSALAEMHEVACATWRRRGQKRALASDFWVEIDVYFVVVAHDFDDLLRCGSVPLAIACPLGSSFLLPARANPLCLAAVRQMFFHDYLGSRPVRCGQRAFPAPARKPRH